MEIRGAVCTEIYKFGKERTTGTTLAAIIMGSTDMLNRWIFKIPKPRTEEEVKAPLGKYMADHLRTQLQVISSSEEFQQVRSALRKKADHQECT